MNQLHDGHRGEVPNDLAEAPRLQIQDLEHYLQRNGIEARQGQPYRPLDQVELAAIVSSEERYQQKVIQKFMEEDNEQLEKDEKEHMQRKEMVLDGIKGKNISILTSDKVLTNVLLYPLVDQCDIIYTLVGSDHWSRVVATAEEDFVFKLLEQFSSKSVSKFISIVNQSSTVQDLRNDTIIECCQMAHLLQCKTVLEEIVEVLKGSIDSENCTSMCVLADELNIQSLLQSSMGFIMDRLEDIQSNDDLWEEMPSSLKAHIVTLRNAASSSIIGRGQKTKVLFSSSDEFLAIFSDTLREHKDRLREAKQRQREIIEERERRNRDRPFFSSRDVYGGSVKDANMKIERQERRVQTLEAFYKEQKAIFTQNLNSKFQSSFSL